jgi:hypothetical protein
MKLSVDTKPEGHTYTVLVDGFNVSNRCFSFDTIEGWADCYILDDKGQLSISDVFEPNTERLHGDVSAVKDEPSES